MSDYSPEKITKSHWNPHEQPSAAGLVVAVQQSCEPLVPSQRPIERKRKERLFVGSADSSGRSGLRPQSRLFHCLSVSQSVSQSWQDAQIGNGLIALRPVFRAASVLPPIGPRGTLFVEHLAIINSVPFLPMDHTSEHLTDPDVLGQLV